jgi:hypothetical protein
MARAHVFQQRATAVAATSTELQESVYSLPNLVVRGSVQSMMDGVGPEKIGFGVLRGGLANLDRTQLSNQVR